MTFRKRRLFLYEGDSMGKIKYSGITKEEAAALYGSWLQGQLPKQGAFLSTGPFYYALGGWKALEETRPIELTAAKGIPVYTSIEPEKTELALRSYREWRRPPAGVLAASTPEGYWITSGKAWEPSTGDLLDFPSLLEEVATDKEIAALYGKTAKAVQKDCESGLFGREARKEGTLWLIETKAAARIYANKTAEPAPISPLLLVYTTAMAGELWGRSAEEVRSAAAGAGHRAARLGDGQRRRAGRTWLVTREAMEMLYGNADPDKWREWILGI